MRASAEREAQKRGHELAAVFDSRDTEVEARKSARVCSTVMAAIARAEGCELTHSATRRAVASRDRDVVDDVLIGLVGSGRLIAIESAQGTRLRLP